MYRFFPASSGAPSLEASGCPARPCVGMVRIVLSPLLFLPSISKRSSLLNVCLSFVLGALYSIRKILTHEIVVNTQGSLVERARSPIRGVAIKLTSGQSKNAYVTYTHYAIL